MNKQIDTKSALITLTKLYVAIDLFWALTVAIFTASLLSSGLSLANCGASTAANLGTASVVTGTLLTFVIAFFQGGVFLFVFSFAAAIIGSVCSSLFKIDFKAIWKYGRWALLAAAVYAFIAATFFNSITSIGFGIISEYAGCLSTISLGFFGSIAGWILAFFLTFIQASIFIVVGSMAIFIMTVVIVSIFGNKNGSAS